MDLQFEKSELYIGGESGPRKYVLDNLRCWLENPNEGKIKPLRGAYYIGKTVSGKFSCKECKAKPIEINWDDCEKTPMKIIDILAEKFSQYYKDLTLGNKAKPESQHKAIIGPYDEIIKIATKVKKENDLLVKYTKLTSLIEYYNRVSKETVVLIVNSCRSQKFKNEFELLFRASMDNNVKVIFEKYEKDKSPVGSSFRDGKIRKNYSETLFFEPPNYDNIKNHIKENLGNVDLDCIIEYVGCHPGFFDLLRHEIRKNEEIDLDNLIKKVKDSNTDFYFHLNCYFNIIKEYESRIYWEYINNFMNVTKIDNNHVRNMIKWGLCYNHPKAGLKTPILFRDHIRDEIKIGNIKIDADDFKLKIIENYEVYKKYEKLISDSSTKEIEIHNLIKDNLWLLGAEFIKLSSNQTLENAARLLKAKYDGSNSKFRPDLILTQKEEENLVLIELKRPNHKLNRDDEKQIKKYRDKLLPNFPNKTIKMVLLGSGIENSMFMGSRETDLDFLSYRELITKIGNNL